MGKMKVILGILLSLILFVTGGLGQIVTAAAGNNPDNIPPGTYSIGAIKLIDRGLFSEFREPVDGELSACYSIIDKANSLSIDRTCSSYLF